MTDILRQEIAAEATCVVVKVGTRVLTHPDGTLDRDRIADLAGQVSQAVDGGRQVSLVSSGAVGAGLNLLGLPHRPTDLSQLQAVAAVGQTHLIEAYDQTFRRHGRHAAQVLLTAQDLDDRVAYLNVRNTLFSLLRFGAIPVINENDTVSVDELMTTFGDNDRLAALVTNLLRAPLLIILSDVEGVYDGDPQTAGARPIPTITQLDENIFSLVRHQAIGLSKGGMASKLEAARITTAAGENVIIASGRRPSVLTDILAGEEVGTLILAQGKSLNERKRWLAFSAQSCGRILVDDGARQAITSQGRSLLSIGIVQALGEFHKGDLVSICDSHGGEIARGLSNYSANDVRLIAGMQSGQISQVLGHRPYVEVIHRDNLALP